MYNKNFLIRNSRKKNKPISQINVTPFVDVMLVLLIVFMITAPLVTVRVKVDLPKIDAPPLMPQKNIVVTVRSNGKIFIQEREIELDKLKPRLTAITSGNKNLSIYVRGDWDSEYKIPLEVIAEIKKSGFRKVLLLGKPKEK